MARFLHCVWDFDGTLFDSYPRMARAFTQALAEFGVAADEAEVYARIKRSVGAACREYGVADNAALLAAFQRIQRAMPLSNMRPYPGAAALCAEVDALGGANYLYTHRDETALRALREHGMDALFRDSVTSLDGFQHKPAPDALLALLARNEIPPERALMIGDRSIDILAARNAGIAGCLFDPEGRYGDFACELRAASFAELRALLLG